MKQNHKLPIVVTVGDPQGIGAELITQLWKKFFPFPWFAIGSQKPFKKQRIPILSFSLKDLLHPTDSFFSSLFTQTAPLPLLKAPSYLSKAKQTFWALKTALFLLKNSKARALVTGPVHKKKLQALEPQFRGHTQWLLQQSHSWPQMASIPTHLQDTTMFFVHSKIKVALVTTHIPIAQVPSLISSKRVQHTIDRTLTALKHLFNIPHPRIALFGLNPHAGEEGLLGTEEKTILIPLIKKYQKKGIYLKGPFPADGFFGAFFASRKKPFDAVIAMYHDQGLVALKAMGFHTCCQLTLGLPFIRTSPAHGVAYDLVGTQRACPKSFETALKLAHKLSLREKAKR